MDRRAELSSDDCLVIPSVQAAIVGTTFNVFNDDKTLHKFVFTRAGTNDTLAVMPFFNEGQVVCALVGLGKTVSTIVVMPVVVIRALAHVLCIAARALSPHAPRPLVRTPLLITD